MPKLLLSLERKQFKSHRSKNWKQTWIRANLCAFVRKSAVICGGNIYIYIYSWKIVPVFRCTFPIPPAPHTKCNQFTPIHFSQFHLTIRNHTLCIWIEIYPLNRFFFLSYDEQKQKLSPKWKTEEKFRSKA